MKLRLLVACLFSLPLMVQGQEMQQPNVPQWLQDFSNMPRTQREAFSHVFNEAKHCYQQQQWAACLVKLNECDGIFARNPSIQTLRVACYQEMELYAEALAIVEQQLLLNPDDVISQYNLSSIYMGMQNYQKCVDVTEHLLKSISMEEYEKFRDLLNFRLFVCILALGDEKRALKIVDYCSIMDDSPLYYMVQSVLSLYQKDRQKALDNLKSAQQIYGNTPNMNAYEKCLKKSGFVSDWDITI
ncbi:MAG: hypothetical protein R3Y56_01855 [Akkermansia sp.]